MIRRDLLTAKDISDLRERCRAVMEEISAELTVMEGNRRAVRSDLWPAASFRDVGIRSDLDEISALPRLSQGTAEKAQNENLSMLSPMS